MPGRNGHEVSLPTAPAPATGWLSREQGLVLVLMGATVLCVYLCYRLAEPFLPALAWALALAVVALPVYRWFESRLRYADLAAGLTVALVVLTLVAPIAFAAHQVGQEAGVGMRHLQQQAEAGRWRETVEQSSSGSMALAWIEQNVDVPAEVSRVVSAVTADMGALVTGSIGAVLQMLITLFVLYYFLRDHRSVAAALRSLVPLSEAETTEVFTSVSDTIHATIFGTLLVALVQGALGGFMFWWLGLPAPILWGAVMALAAVVPWLGAFIIWAPVAVFFALQGDWNQALLLAGWGTIVVGMIDNVLYPLLVGHRLRLHTLPVFFAIVGGLALFGASGMILGPVILAVTRALIEVWRRRTHNGRTAEAGVLDGKLLTTT